MSNKVTQLSLNVKVIFKNIPNLLILCRTITYQCRRHCVSMILIGSLTLKAGVIRQICFFIKMKQIILKLNVRQGMHHPHLI